MDKVNQVSPEIVSIVKNGYSEEMVGHRSFRFIHDLSIRSKMILIIVSTSALMLIIGFVLILFNEVDLFRKDMKSNALLNARTLGEYCAVPLVFDVPESADETLAKLNLMPMVEQAVVYDRSKQLFARYHRLDMDSSMTQPILKTNSIEFRESHLEIYQPIVYAQEVVGTIFMQFSTESLNQKIMENIQSTLLLLGAIILSSYLFASRLQRIISIPVQRLTLATRRISAEGNYQLRVEKDGNDEIGSLVDEYNKMLEQVHIREETLRLRSEELSEAFENLRKTQTQLVQSEKMAALGQLIAGVAHEVNTPLGAIRSSVTNIQNTLQETLEKLPAFLESLDREERSFFEALMKRSMESESIFSSQEERNKRKSLNKVLMAAEIEESYALADTLVDIQIYDDIEAYIPVLKNKQGEEILFMVYRLSGLLRSSNNIEIATNRASKVLFALKNFARMDSMASVISADIREGIETVLTLYTHQLKHGVEVSREYDEIPNILCYPDELNQVWTNLLHNALQAMDYSGQLTIRIINNSPWIEVSFTDSGTGIPPEIMEQIFDPFFTTKPAGEGSGLGLDISRQIIERHAGKIHVESIPQRTVFTISLPMKTES